MNEQAQNVYALLVRMDGLSEKMDAIHLSLEKDIAELKGMQVADGQRISKTELRMAQLQGMGAALTFGMPFIVIAINHLIGG